ncbi:MAG: hypothetical protein K0R05_3602 [Anaerocolumna sp.]|jgi:hypothetical protein|nr:hypothetical protein [Anaerocolumna sp.]
MEGYGMTNSFNNEDANNVNSPNTTGSASSPENNSTINSVGNYNTGNHGSGYPYGYFNGAVNPAASGFKNTSAYYNNSAGNNASDNLSANDDSYDSNNAYSNGFDTTYQDNPEGTESSSQAGAAESDSSAADNSREPGSEEIPPNENNLKHMLDIMKAAFPHLDNETQESASLIIQTTELIDTLQTVRNKDRVSAFSFRGQNIDIVALLTSIRNVCYARERQIIDSILNMMNMKNMFETYSALSSMMASQTENADSSAENNTNSTETNGGFGSGLNPNMMELLGTMLSPEQKSTFDNISMMFNMMQEN